jgi:hypothetical protein
MDKRRFKFQSRTGRCEASLRPRWPVISPRETGPTSTGNRAIVGESFGEPHADAGTEQYRHTDKEGTVRSPSLQSIRPSKAGSIFCRAKVLPLSRARDDLVCASRLLPATCSISRTLQSQTVKRSSIGSARPQLHGCASQCDRGGSSAVQPHQFYQAHTRSDSPHRHTSCVAKIGRALTCLILPTTRLAGQ